MNNELNGIGKEAIIDEFEFVWRYRGKLHKSLVSTAGVRAAASAVLRVAVLGISNCMCLIQIFVKKYFSGSNYVYDSMG
jgi:hypothetical protein